jgi:hypothetical protein
VSDQELQALVTAVEAGKDEGVKFWIRCYYSSLMTEDFKKTVLQMQCKHDEAT